MSADVVTVSKHEKAFWEEVGRIRWARGQGHLGCQLPDEDKRWAKGDGRFDACFAFPSSELANVALWAVEDAGLPQARTHLFEVLHRPEAKNGRGRSEWLVVATEFGSNDGTRFQLCATRELVEACVARSPRYRALFWMLVSAGRQP